MFCGGVNRTRMTKLSFDELDLDLYLSYLVPKKKAIRSIFVFDSIHKCRRLVLQSSFSNRSNGYVFREIIGVN
jgi:hypothetical protein